MTVAEFNARLEDFGQQFRVSQTNNFWEQAIEKVTFDLRAMGITRNPSTNINWTSEGNDVNLEIAPHLLFQNYGVVGLTNRTRQYGVPNEVGLNPLGSGSQFQFGVNPKGKHYWGIHYPGINAKYDFDVRTGTYNITEEFLRYFEAIQEQQSNL